MKVHQRFSRRGALLAARTRMTLHTKTILGVLLAIVPSTIALLPPPAQAQTGRMQEEDRVPELLIRWPYYQEIPLPDPNQNETPWYDVLLGPPVYDGARRDLGDLRLYDATQREVPYALRIRRPEISRQQIEANIFNRTTGPDDSREFSLDLGEVATEHNEVELDTPGMDFRRLVRIDGSDDAMQWRLLAENHLVRFQVDDQEISKWSVEYSPSRFRYLRVRVYPDPAVDEEPVEIQQVAVYRRIALPGEHLTQDARLWTRQPTPVRGAAGSSWVIDLGGRNVPCERILVEEDSEAFVRNYWIEAAGPPDEGEPFREIARGVWRREAGEPKEPLIADFPEVQAARLRLLIQDHRNPPLQIHHVQFRAPVRQLVFPSDDELEGPLQLYYGNLQAEAPHYDFARHLPERLEPPPNRLQLGPRQGNPDFTPEPLPLTERWPWLIYVVLTLAIAVLGLLIANLARTAVNTYDQEAGT